MIRLILCSVLFPLQTQTQPSGSVDEAPTSLRSFSPAGTAEDTAIKTYFENAGPLAVEFYEHLTFLSNPRLGGRKPGSEGSEIAGDYITWNLQKFDLQPAFESGNSWYQPFVFNIDNTAPILIDSFVAIDDMALVPERDYVVLGNSGSGEVRAPVTFVGYAIENGEDEYSSFDEDTDLEGTIALMLRYEPLDENGASQWARRRFSPHSNIKDKMNAVITRGAVGVILVNPPNCRDGRRGLEGSRSSRFGSTDIPVVQVTAEIANLLTTTTDIAALQVLADHGEISTMEIGNATLHTDVVRSGLHANNIGGILEGKGDLAEEWVVIGGHYDHVGFGYTGTSTPGVLHTGADDNASGSSGVLILARLFSEYYAEVENESLRSILFLFFDAEEAGLRGSDYFVKEPSIDLDQINAMINLDMIGRLRNNNLMLGGTGTATEFETLVPELFEASTLKGSLSPGGTGPSDHTNFYKNDIPVLFFFTGMTDEYHTPKDRAYTTNPAGGALIVELAEEFGKKFVSDQWLTFSTNTNTGGSGKTTRMPSPVRLGVHPSYSAEIETGILLTGVSEGTSAEDAGLQAEDILLAWNDIELTGGSKLMELLRASAPGDEVDLTVQRDGENIIVKVTLKAP